MSIKKPRAPHGGNIYISCGQLLLLLLLFPALTKAQNKKEKAKEKPPTFNYVIDDPMDQFGRTPEAPATITENDLLPDFYSYTATKRNDTTYKFECYNYRDSILNIDTVRNIDEVRFISLFKSYPDPTHTYTDENKNKLPLPISSIIKRYDKVGADRWMSIDYAGNKYTKLMEHRQEIVRTETIQALDPQTGKTKSKTYKYYRTTESK